MKIYLHSANAEKAAAYPVNVSPAGDTDFVKSADMLDEWKLADGRPKQFQIVFKFGAAEVDDAIARYMVARGIAYKHRDWLGGVKRLFGLNTPQLFDSRGKPIEAFDGDGRPIILGGNLVG